MPENRPQTEQEWKEWKDSIFDVLEGIQKMQIANIDILRSAMEKQMTIQHFIYKIMVVLKPELGMLDVNTDEVEQLIDNMTGLINESNEVG